MPKIVEITNDKIQINLSASAEQFLRSQNNQNPIIQNFFGYFLIDIWSRKFSGCYLLFGISLSSLLYIFNNFSSL